MATQVVRTVDVLPLTLRAELAPDTINEEQRTVEVTFSTGADVLRTDFWTGQKWIERLSLKREHVRLDRLNNGGPVLDTHSAWSVTHLLGVVVPGTARLEPGGPGGGMQAKATIQFSKRDAVAPIWQDIRDGVIRSVSTGYRVHKFIEDAGTDGKLPIRTAVDWEPFELSMVPLGADPGAKTRSEDSATNPCVVITRAQEETMDKESQEPTKPTTIETPAPTIAAAPTGGETVRDVDAERQRAAAITKLVQRAKLPAEFATQLIEAKRTLDEARAAVLDELAKQSDQIRTDQTVRVDVVEAEADKWRRGAAAWLYEKAAVGDLIRQAAKKTPDHPAFQGVPLDAGQFRGMSLLDLARDSLERHGIRTRGLDKMRVAELALRVSGAQTTSDFAVALENTLHKTLLAAYTIAPDDWRRFCAIGSVTDFRAHHRYRTGYFGRLDVVGEHGEFLNKALPDAAKESITAQTRGNIVSLTRHAIVNDDMGVFNRVALQIGRAAALSIELDVFDLLKLNGGLGPIMNDGQTLFHATHANIGTGSVLGVAALDGDRVVMATQTDPSGNEVLNLRPAILVLPVGLGGEARTINDAQFDTDPVAANATNKFQKPNKVRGLFRDIVDSPHLTGTRRYLFADPALMPVIEVAFLEGQQEPFLEAQEGWRIDGVEWKVRLDYGVAAIEVRGAVTNAGTA